MITVRIDDGSLIDWTLTDDRRADHVVTKLTGWYGAPVRVEKTDLWQDGAHQGQMWRGGRELTIAGFHRLTCHPDPAGEAERLKRAVAGAFRSGSTAPGRVAVTDETGVTLEAFSVQLDGAPLFTTWEGMFSWELPLFAGDPYLYETGRFDVTVTPAGAGSGLVFPLFDDEAGATTGFLEWAGENITGGGALTNLGNATAYPQVTVTGDWPSGFRLVLAGDKDDSDPGWGVTYLGSVNPAVPVVVDMGGAVTVAGVDQGWALADTSWGGVSPGGQVTVSVEPVTVGAGTAQMTLRSTYL